MSEQATDAIRRERVLAGALERILASLEGDLIGAQRLRDTVRETATSALREAGVTKGWQQKSREPVPTRRQETPRIKGVAR